MTRKYELKRRAERLAETRERIVEATVGLHASVGPAHTTISAIAEQAGVQRHTVYAHFRDERELFDACSAHWAALHPFPDAARWAAIDDPKQRLREALDAVYEWYGGVGDDLIIFKRDSGRPPDDRRARCAARAGAPCAQRHARGRLVAPEGGEARPSATPSSSRPGTRSSAATA